MGTSTNFIMMGLIKYSRTILETLERTRATWIQLFSFFKNATPSISRYELATMLEDTKTRILHSFSMQIDTMQLKMKRKESEKALVIFCYKCRRKHDNNQCPLDVVDFHGICSNKHPTDKYPFLPPLKHVLTRESP